MVIRQTRVHHCRKTLLSAEKTHVAHDGEIDKYEGDLRELERLRRDYEDKLQDESQSAGRNLALEEDQVNDRFVVLSCAFV